VIAVAAGEIVNAVGLGEEDVIEAEVSTTAETVIVIGSVGVDEIEIAKRKQNRSKAIETVAQFHLQRKMISHHHLLHLQMKMERKKNRKRIQQQKQKHKNVLRR
jgi:hypothetical protein